MSISAVSHVVPVSVPHHVDGGQAVVRTTKDSEAKVRQAKSHEAQSSGASAKDSGKRPSHSDHKVDVKV